MATNDGYSPYPIGLTASQTVEAIMRAYNLSDGDFVKYVEGLTAPTSPKMGDIWNNLSENKAYRAYVDGSDVVWLEV
jgi:hypothetical protein